MNVLIVMILTYRNIIVISGLGYDFFFAQIEIKLLLLGIHPQVRAYDERDRSCD